MILRVTVADRALLGHAAVFFDKPLRDDAIDRFLESADHHLLLALDGDQPVGFVSGDPDNAAALATYRGAGATIEEPNLLMEWKL